MYLAGILESLTTFTIIKNTQTKEQVRRVLVAAGAVESWFLFPGNSPCSPPRLQMGLAARSWALSHCGLVCPLTQHLCQSRNKPQQNFLVGLLSQF